MKSSTLTQERRKAGIVLAVLMFSLTLSFALTLFSQGPILPASSKTANVSTSGKSPILEPAYPKTISSAPVSLLATQSLTASFTFTPSNPAALLPLTLNATVSGGSTPYTFAWTFGDGNSGVGNPTVHTYGAGGSYNATLRVTDNNGAISSISRTINVKVFNSPPQPIFTCYPSCTPPLLFTGEPIFFDGSASRDPDGYIVSYLWRFGDDASQTGVAAAVHTYPYEDVYPVTLTVTDDSGETREFAQSAYVRPALTLTLSSNVTQGFAPLFIKFDVTASGGQSPYSYSWDFGDGQTSTRKSPVHNYTNTIPRVYSVQITVTDSLGHAVTSEVPITVATRAFEPNLLGVSITTLQLGGVLTVTAFLPVSIYALVRRGSKGGRKD